MSILIHGVSMPKDGYIDVRLFADGWAHIQTGEHPYNKAFEAIELPPHGRVIDVDEMERFMSEGVRGDIRSYPYEDETWGEAFRWMDSRPTIIPAEGGDAE